MNEREAYIALNMMEKVGPVSVRSLVGELGSAGAIFEADKRQLMSASGVAAATAEAILAGREATGWKSEIEKSAALGIRLVAQIDPEYPEQLLAIHDPPLALYVKGEFKSRDKRAIGVVGSRRPTYYGKECAERMGSGLARAGYTVVSGLATGIDTAAHEGALKANGRTIAVIGSGLDKVYPPANRELAEEVAKSGALVSEFPLGRNPDKTTFPMRNRVVSGLSMGVVVVEAGPRSGALITADQALDQGRTVFAMPGRVDSRLSQGAHRLIKEGARLVEHAEDVLEEFDLLLPHESAGKPSGYSAELTKEESELACRLDGGGVQVDDLIRATGMKPAEVNAMLIGLEMKGVVRMLPGRVVEMRRGADG